jgi:copper chaperone CopZ
MQLKYQLSGMTCKGCEAHVKYKLLSLPFVTEVEVSKETNMAIINMESFIAISEFQNILGGNDSKYKINEIKEIFVAETKTWFTTYQPILLIFAYIVSITILLQFNNKQFNVMQWMQHFMAAFFLVFSFFKMLNLKGFAQSYAMYDILAKKTPIWGYVYPFVELGLGICFLVNFYPFFTNIFTLLIMVISIVGVLKSVVNKQKIQCACLGAVFNLPMSSLTIIEDAIMIAMSVAMLLLMK